MAQVRSSTLTVFLGFIPLQWSERRLVISFFNELTLTSADSASADWASSSLSPQWPPSQVTNSCLNGGTWAPAALCLTSGGHSQSDPHRRCCAAASWSVASQVVLFFFRLFIVFFFFFLLLVADCGEIRGPRDESPVVEPSAPPLDTHLEAERGSYREVALWSYRQLRRSTPPPLTCVRPGRKRPGRRISIIQTRKLFFKVVRKCIFFLCVSLLWLLGHPGRKRAMLWRRSRDRRSVTDTLQRRNNDASW